MGCINVQVTSLKTNINVKANSNDKCIVKVNNLLHSIVKINGIIHNINLKTKYTNNCLVKLIYLPYILSLKTTLNNKISVSAGLVCTASIRNDLELWWCDGWKMLWNNKIKALWPEG